MFKLFVSTVWTLPGIIESPVTSNNESCGYLFPKLWSKDQVVDGEDWVNILLYPASIVVAVPPTKNYI